MTSAERRDALAEVTAARAQLVETLNQLEDAVNVPKRLARSLGRGMREAKLWAADRPAAAAGIAAAGIAVVGVAVTALIRRSLR